MMTRVRLAAALGVLALLTGGVATDDTRPAHQGHQCYFGTLHAHCSLSGDFVPRVARPQLRTLLENNFETGFSLQNGPMAAWRHAAERAKIDFVALTDHIRASDNPDRDVGMPERGYDLLRQAAERINTDPNLQGKFLAIPGMEWNDSSEGNHINILFARKPVPLTIANGDYVTLRNRYFNNPDFEGGNRLLVVQMNHARSLSADYGRAQFASGATGAAAFVSDFRDVYSAIEHINNHENGNANTREQNDHQDGNSREDDYQRYLNLGFRVAPVGDHDNHRPNWGRHTAARTGVWAQALTPDEFARSYRARRMFATEDNELAVLFLADSEWMGSVIPIPSQGRVVTFTVRIDQIRDTDANQFHDEGPYRIELFGDEDGIGGSRAAPVRMRQGNTLKLALQVAQGTTIQFTRRVRPGSYYYLHVQEGTGRDAGGALADAWTAPVWYVRQ